VAEVEDELAINADGPEIKMLVLAIHPFASVTVRNFVPWPKLFTEAVVEPSLHKYEYGATPPVTLTATAPLSKPEQVTPAEVIIVTDGPLKFGTAAVTGSWHPLASVIVAMNVPPDTFIRVVPVCPGVLFQLTK